VGAQCVPKGNPEAAACSKSGEECVGSISRLQAKIKRFNEAVLEEAENARKLYQ
jgi:hypothetical protein